MEERYILHLLFSFLVSVDCIMWNLEPGTRKCLKEELQQNVPVVGEFEVSEAPGQTIDYIVSLVTINLSRYFVNCFVLGNRFQRTYFGSKARYF